jgi:hypothetical protein
MHASQLSAGGPGRSGRGAFFRGWRRFARGQLTRVLGVVAVATVLTVPGLSAAARSSPPPISTAKWQQALQQLRVPGIGCFTASYPLVQWLRTQCEAAPHDAYSPVSGHRPQAAGHGIAYTVGDNTDYTAEVSSGSLSSVTGSFDSISPGATEHGQFDGMGPEMLNTFSLQLNTNFFASPACTAMQAPNPQCQGWEQFLYSTTFNMVLIEYTLKDYNLNTFNANCPTGWMVTGLDCAMNTFGTGLSSPLTVQDLPGTKLTASASPGGDDTAMLITPSGTAKAVNADDILGLANNWTNVEWGVFGDGGGLNGVADFSPGTTLVARTTFNNGGTTAPLCVDGGTTAESNNLFLNPPVPGRNPPALISTQTSNPSSAQLGCAYATGFGDTHLLTFGKLQYDFQASGDFVLATTGPRFIVENRQVSGAPAWPNAAVNQAVAARIGTSDVAVCTTPTRLVINNKPVNLANGGQFNLPGGGTVSLNGNVYLIQDTTGDSVSARIHNGSPNWIDASVGLGRWPETVHGLLANARSDVHSLQARSGPVLTAPFAFNEFYRLYGNSWRVPPGQSLLSACGRRIASGNPRNVFYPNNLPPRVAKLGRAACRAAGVQAAPLPDACIVDFAMLGKGALLVYSSLPADVTWGKINPPNR